MAKTIRLEVITPARMFYRGDIELVVIRTASGEEGFMAGHVWARKLIDVGPLRIREAGGRMKCAVIDGGYLDVSDTIIMIYTDAAEWDSEINLQLAEDQKEAAEKYLRENRNLPEDDPNIIAVRKGLARSKTRIRIAKKREKTMDEKTGK